MNWQKAAGAQLALPRCAQLHLPWKPGCLQTADTGTILWQTPLPHVQPSLGRVCAHTLPPLACSPFQHKGTFHRSRQARWQVRRLHLQSLSDLSSAIENGFVCSVLASKLTSVTMHTEKAWGKTSNLEYFPLSHAFWPTTVLYPSVSSAIISDPLLANPGDPQQWCDWHLWPGALATWSATTWHFLFTGMGTLLQIIL